MFYAGPQGQMGPPGVRPGFFPPQMVQQRRWNGPGQPPMQMQGQPPQGYPGQAGGIPPPQFQRGQMPPQAGRGGMMRPPQHHQQPMQVPAARPPGRGGYKYTANARNAPQPAGLVGAPTTAPKSTLNASALAGMTEALQKQSLGEALFPKIASFTAEPGMAGKVTGMLLEMDNSELLHLLEDDAALRDKVSEATAVLEEHKASA